MSDVNVPNGWRHEDNALRREFTFTNFVEAFAFMTSIAEMAEAADHHPDWSNSYNTVTIALTSHDKGCVTQRDSSLAEQINSLV
ncbi:MAG: 4a-hydroxytetrahydrobiopterin dehydratase [Ilumatobacteraceae bacterium]|jgi:4a-hydroxytetrahydrobiopterin dehydratase|nr:4a-hydroxytetrahydrobiopterin dehydratase [Ilumatobacteraceae bacterium]MBJ7369615.1 4a-hydroxytetrahydrobiopterin dehydratase [Ilumatobacteraceae bacterium]MBJ7491147.1 4a-hydroxytetrahydrobiopterin dehydratase [Ilumatobacteraceae bacterium]